MIPVPLFFNSRAASPELALPWFIFTVPKVLKSNLVEAELLPRMSPKFVSCVIVLCVVAIDNVASPLVAPPDKPVPALTDVMSPVPVDIL